MCRQIYTKCMYGLDLYYVFYFNKINFSQHGSITKIVLIYFNFSIDAENCINTFVHSLNYEIALKVSMFEFGCIRKSLCNHNHIPISFGCLFSSLMFAALYLAENTGQL